MNDWFTSQAIFSFLQIVLINVVLSGDNAIVIGMVASRVAPEHRPKVIGWGLTAAVLLRLIFSLLAVYLLNVLGLTLAGGLLLLWVAWRLYRDLREAHEEEAGLIAMQAEEAGGDGQAARVPAGRAPYTLRRAVFQVALADLSMSLDNALAIAGAAERNIGVMVAGLVLSIAFMGVAATYIAKVLQRLPWLNYVGVALILYIALHMIWTGGFEVLGVMAV